MYNINFCATASILLFENLNLSKTKIVNKKVNTPENNIMV